MNILDALKQAPICTCQWSAVNTTTIDPPYPVRRDPRCPIHGLEEIACHVCGVTEDDGATLTCRYGQWWCFDCEMDMEAER